MLSSKHIKLFLSIFCLCLILNCLISHNTNDLHLKKAIIVGASSGIGEAVARELLKRGCIVGITARRKDLLESFQKNMGTNVFLKVIDVAQPEAAQKKLRALIDEMGGLDLIVVSSGTGNCDLDWEKQKEILDVNVVGFAAIVNEAMQFFLQHNKGHIVGISSIAALRGFVDAPMYSASKAFVSNYLQGLREKFKKLNKSITVTDIQPGFVDTHMGQSSNFWKASPEKAAQQICDAIQEKRDHAYITKRWRLIAWLIKVLPDYFFYKIF